MVYEDKNVNKVLHICRHYFLILLMFTFYIKFILRVCLVTLKILNLTSEDLFNLRKNKFPYIKYIA